MFHSSELVPASWYCARRLTVVLLLLHGKEPMFWEIYFACTYTQFGNMKKVSNKTLS